MTYVRKTLRIKSHSLVYQNIFRYLGRNKGQVFTEEQAMKLEEKRRGLWDSYCKCNRVEETSVERNINGKYTEDMQTENLYMDDAGYLAAFLYSSLKITGGSDIKAYAFASLILYRETIRNAFMPFAIDTCKIQKIWDKSTDELKIKKELRQVILDSQANFYVKKDCVSNLLLFKSL